ncbi:MAG: SLC13 family permease [Gemmatimonadales bacterium]|nr:MAG: SLC13 family permease [Gemmatimonadales bacterium]
MLLVYGILVVTVVLFVSERLRLDVVALMALLALTLTGILSPDEALAGFADPVVIMIAALFVVGDGLFQTGVASSLGRLPSRLAGNSETKLLIVIMLLVAILSGFMSSTGTVAVMLPVVMGLAWARDIPPSKLLIPLSVASLLGGMLTLIGTAPNIVVSNHLEAMGRDPFGLFAFTPIGIAMVIVGIAFMTLVGRRLLPDRPAVGAPAGKDDPSVEELAGSWGLPAQLHRLHVPPDSPLIGRSLQELDWAGSLGLTVLEVLREAGERSRFRPGRMRDRRRRKADSPGPSSTEDREMEPALADTVLRPGDLLLVQGSPDGVARLVSRGHARLVERTREGDPTAEDSGIAEVLLTPRSRLLGKTLKELLFRDHYQLSVIGVKRMGELLEGDLGDVALRFGDTLLVQGEWEAIRRLGRETRNFVVTLAPREMGPALQPLDRAPVAVAIIVGMLGLMTFGVVPAVTAVLVAAVAMVLFRCVTVEDAYRSVNWESVVLIAGILPMATALENTGGMQLIVDQLASAMEGTGPILLLGVLFVLTSVLSQVISNTATAVLLAPIAFQLSTGIGANPEPFMMTIAVAASTAFATPVASPVNTLVLGPGGYRFGDFFKVGVALQALVLVVTVVLVPVLFPF